MPLPPDYLTGPDPVVDAFPRPRRDSYPLTRYTLEQQDLFPSSLEELSNETGVSLEEMGKWHHKGLLSFAPDRSGRYQTAHTAELLFLRGVTRAGFDVDALERVLGTLDKPYAYHPTATVYSFFDNRWYGLDPGAPPTLFHSHWEFWRRVLREDRPEQLLELRQAIDRRLHEIEHDN